MRSEKMESCYYILFPSKVILVTTIFTFFFCFPSSSDAANFSRIFAFGDSFTDTGNTNSFSGPVGFGASRFPYGMTFFKKPTGRFSDGRLMVDFVSEALNLPYLPPYRNQANMDTSHGVNFAVAGGTAIEHEFFVMNGITIDLTLESLQTELQWFNSFLEEKGCGGGANTNGDCTKFFDETLFWVGEIGANDYGYTRGSLVSPIIVQQLVIERLSSFLEEVLKKGAKYIVVQGLPPVGCLALSMTYSPIFDKDDMGCVGSANLGINQHNSELQNKLEDIRSQFPQAVISYADYYNAYREVMMNTGNYGFQEPFRVCCGSGGGLYNFNPVGTCGSPAALIACPNPSQFINWDGVHLTEAMYKVVADFLLNGGYCHPPFTDLLKGS